MTGTNEQEIPKGKESNEQEIPNGKEKKSKAGRPKSVGVPLKDLKVANAIKVASKELTYMGSEHYDIRMHNNLFIEVTNKVPPGHKTPKDTVYTSIMNAISWHK